MKKQPSTVGFLVTVRANGVVRERRVVRDEPSVDVSVHIHSTAKDVVTSPVVIEGVVRNRATDENANGINLHPYGASDVILSPVHQCNRVQYERPRGDLKVTAPALPVERCDTSLAVQMKLLLVIDDDSAGKSPRCYWVHYAARKRNGHDAA